MTTGTRFPYRGNDRLLSGSLRGAPAFGRFAQTTRSRDPEDRVVEPSDREGVREKMFDKTVADSFPASDPPSTIPDPEEDSF